VPRCTASVFSWPTRYEKRVEARGTGEVPHLLNSREQPWDLVDGYDMLLLVTPENDVISETDRVCFDNTGLANRSQGLDQ